MTLSYILSQIYRRKFSYLTLYTIFNAALIILLFSLPKEYTSESSLSANNLKIESTTRSISSPLLFGFQSMDGDIAVATEYIDSREFIFFITEKYSLHKHYLGEEVELDFESKEDIYEILKEKLNLKAVKELVGVYQISLTSFDRDFSSSTLKNIITDLNVKLAEKDFKNSEKRINSILLQLAESKNDYLNESLSNLLNEEIKKQTLSLATPEEYIFKSVSIPYAPKERSYPASRLAYLLIAQVIFFLTAMFYVVFSSTIKQLYLDTKEELNE